MFIGSQRVTKQRILLKKFKKLKNDLVNCNQFPAIYQWNASGTGR